MVVLRGDALRSDARVVRVVVDGTLRDVVVIRDACGAGCRVVRVVVRDAECALVVRDAALRDG